MIKIAIPVGIVVLLGPVVFFFISAYRASDGLEELKNTIYFNAVTRNDVLYYIHWIEHEGRVAFAVFDDRRFADTFDPFAKSNYYQVHQVTPMLGVDLSIPVIFHPEKGRIEPELDGTIYQLAGSHLYRESINISSDLFEAFLRSGEAISITGVESFLNQFEHNSARNSE